MNDENRELPDLNDEAVSEILEDSGFVDNLLQMRVIGRDGESHEVTLAVMKVQDTWFCTRLSPPKEEGRRRMSRSKKSLRTALNREIKKFLDEKGFDDDTSMSSLKDLVADVEKERADGNEDS